MGGGGDDVSAGDGGGDDRVNIKVKNATGSKYDARVSLDDTVGDFKEALSLKCDVPASQQRLIYKGQILKDDHRALRSYGQGRLQTRADQSSLGFPEFALTAEDFPLLTPTVHNPAGSRLILDSISRPQLSTESIRSDPQLQRRPDYGALYREIVRAREFFQMASPEILLLFLIVLQTLLSLLGEEQSTRERRETGQTDGDTGSVNNSELQALLNRFSGLGTGSAAVPNRPNVPPEELYAAQLSQLQEMGFFDRYENIQALMNTAGNVNAAVERLLRNSGR